MNLSMIEIWHSTGAIARGVVMLLGAMSLVATAIGIEKWRRLRRAERASGALVAAWRADGSSLEALAGLPTRFPASPVADLVATVVGAAGRAPAEARGEIHDRLVRRSVLTTGSDLRRGLAAIATVGSTAPFVGLFGTVVGVVNAFHELGGGGRGGIATISSGIAEALVTTAVGIMVAIPAVWVFNALSQRIGRLLVVVEALGEEMAVAGLVQPVGARSQGSDAKAPD